jgi:cytochrome c biogenesis protein CcdA/DsbC/DsbD-like thiol-disulfide interchange protein/thiol-disulfide isomerase/thioredoxin
MTRAFPAARGASILALALAASAAGLAQEIRVPQPAKLTPILEDDGARTGRPVRAALQVSLEEGLHTNSNKPRDPNLIPIELTIDPPAGITVAEIVYPEPKDLKQQGADQPLSVFERDFPIGVVLDIAPDAKVGEITVPAVLRYQACDEKQCYFPVRLKTAWTLRIVGADAPVKPLNSEAFGRIAFGRGEKPNARLKPALSERERVEGPALSERERVGGPALSERERVGGPALSERERVGGPAREGVARLDDFALAGSAAGFLGAGDFTQFIRDAEAGVRQKGMFEGQGPLAILLLVFLGGLALNLTPCVLPMIPINLAIIGAGSQAGSRSRGFLLGSAYGAAMAFVYGVLGLVVILTAGTFGTINSSPWFNGAIAVVFVVLALAMFDVIVIDFSSVGRRFRVNEESRGTLLVAFTMGGIAALLAGACVAPVVVQVVLFSSNLYASGTTAALALPFVLGLGMAAPWPIAGAGISALPKPGAWMVRVKQVFGVVILATAVYYGYQAYLLLANRWVDASEVSASVEAKLKEGWHSDLASGLAQATREKKPVLIDLWATWCKNCLVMDKTTLASAEVTAALSGYVKIKVQAETFDVSPAKEIIQRYGVVGLPTYVILKPKQ